MMDNNFRYWKIIAIIISILCIDSAGYYYYSQAECDRGFQQKMKQHNQQMDKYYNTFKHVA